MFPVTVIRWWPVVGVSAMVLLALAVGRGSTVIDDWFIVVGDENPDLSLLLLFTNPWVLVVVMLAVLAVAIYQHRWRLSAAVAATPVVAVVVARLFKQVLRRERDGWLAYPSGHTTLVVVVMGMVVLVAGAAVWAVAIAVTWAALGLFGQAFTYHYFTDTVGALLLGTAFVCLAVRVAGLDRCQPSCDLHHSDG